MEEILHQLIWRIHHYVQGFIHLQWWSPDFWTINRIFLLNNVTGNWMNHLFGLVSPPLIGKIGTTKPETFRSSSQAGRRFETQLEKIAVKWNKSDLNCGVCVIESLERLISSTKIENWKIDMKLSMKVSLACHIPTKKAFRGFAKIRQNVFIYSGVRRFEPRCRDTHPTLLYLTVRSVVVSWRSFFFWVGFLGNVHTWNFLFGGRTILTVHKLRFFCPRLIQTATYHL